MAEPNDREDRQPVLPGTILTPEQRAQMTRDIMDARGQDGSVMDFSDKAELPGDGPVTGADTSWMTTTDQDSAYYWGEAQRARQALAEDFGQEFASAIDPADLASEMMHLGLRDADGVLSGAAHMYGLLRESTATNITDAAMETGNWFERKMSAFLGNDDVQLAMSLGEPLLRPQQAWYTLLRGEGFDRAWGKMRPKVNITLADNSQDTVDPFLVALENLSLKLTGSTEYDEDGNPVVSNQSARDESNAKIAEVQEQMMSEDRLLEFRDVMDTWAGGEDNMDKVYQYLFDEGPYKYQRRFLAGALSTFYAGNEIFNDPLFFLPPVRRLFAKGGKALLTSTASRARRTAEVATRTNLIDDMSEAINAASDHLRNALNKYRDMPTIENAKRVEQAHNLYLERVEHREMYNANRAIGDHSTINIDTPIQPGNGVADLSMTREFVETTHTGRRVPNVAYEREWTRPTIVRRIRKGYDDLASAREAKRPVRDIQMYEDEIKYYEDMLHAWDNLGWRAGLRMTSVPATDNTLLHISFDATMGNTSTGVRFYRGGVQRGGQNFATARVNPRARVLRLRGGRRLDMIKKQVRQDKDKGIEGIKMADMLTWPRNPGWFVLRYFELDKELSELQRFSMAGHRARDLVEHSTVPMSNLTDAGRKLTGEYPALTKMLQDMEIGLLNEINDTTTLGEILGIHTARSLGYDAIEMGPINPRLTADIIETSSESIKYGAQDMRVLQDMSASQYIALSPKAVDKLNGIPLSHREFYDDLTRMRNEIRSERSKVKKVDKDRGKEMDNALRQIDAYLEAMENGDLHKVPATVEFPGGHVRTRTADETREAMLSEQQSARSMDPEQFQPRETLQGNLFEDPDLARRVAVGSDESEQAADFLGRVIQGDDPLELYMPEPTVPEFATKTFGERIPGVGPELQIQGERVAANLKSMRQAEIDKARLWIPEKLLDDGTFMPERFVRFTQPNLYDEAQKIAKKEGTKFDDSWLPKPRPTTAELVESGWMDARHAMGLHRISRGLFPGTWYPKTTGILATPVMNVREPMRVVEEVDPGVSWPLLLNATRNQTAEYERAMSVASRALDDLGAITIEEPGAIRQKLMTDARRRVTRNEERGREIFELLEMDSSSDDYIAALSAMSEGEQQAMRALRGIINEHGGKLGLFGSNKWIENYMPHIFNYDDLRRGAVPPEMRGLGTNGNIFISHLLGRSGDQAYVKDPYDVLDLYFRATSRKIHLEPAMHDFLKRANHISKQEGKGWYLPYAEGVVQQLKGQPSYARQWLSNHYARGMAAHGRPYEPDIAGRRLTAVAGAVYAGLLAGNPRYVIMSIASNLATTGAEFGMFRTAKGLFMNATPEGQALFKAAGGDVMWQQIFEDDSYRAIREVASRGRLGAPSIQDTEDFIRGTTMMAAIDQSLDIAGYPGGFEGLRMAADAGFANKIIFDAVRKTQEVNHFFGPMGKPPAFTRASRSGATVATQFKAFTPKQSEQLLAMGRRDPGKIFDYLALSGWLTRMAASELGLNIRSYTGFGYVTDMDPRQLGESPSLDVLVKGITVLGEMSALVAGKGDPNKAHRALDDYLKSMENLVPLVNVGRTRTRAERMLEQGIQEYGLGTRAVETERMTLGPVSVPIPGGDKGNKNEAFGILTGVETEVQRRHRMAQQDFRKLKAEAAYQTVRLIDEALVAAQTGDMEGMMQRAQKLHDMNIPVGDLSDPILTRMRLQTMDWTFNAFMDNPTLRMPMMEVLHQWGVMQQPEVGNE